uniref:Uncharacterized protein n=1 Tax=Oryza nivara TaxID=4536 RepID=A0A0E0FIH1_ORYNI
MGIILSYGQEEPLCKIQLIYFILYFSLYIHFFFLFVCNQFHTLPFFSCAPAKFQQLSSESKKLSMNVEHIIAQVSQAVNMNMAQRKTLCSKNLMGITP